MKVVKPKTKYEKIMSDWTHTMMRICLVIVIAAALVEVSFAIQFEFRDPGAFVAKTYIPRYVIFPTVINIVSFLIARVLLKKNKLSERKKNMIPLLLLTIMISVIMVMHYIFQALYVLIIIPLFASIVFGNRYVTSYMFHVLVVVLGINVAIIWYTKESDIQNFVYNVVVAYIILLLSYRMTLGIVACESAKGALIAETLKQNEVLEEERLIDGLTRINNHTGLYEIVDKVLGKKDGHMPLFMAVIDIDFFKQINDDFGHEVGNDVLIRLGQLLKQEENKNVDVGRYGGEEFCMFFHGLTAVECIKKVKFIHDAFGMQKYEIIDRKITLSAGLASYDSGMTISEFIAKADKYLYQAKNSGRDRIVVEEAMQKA